MAARPQAVTALGFLAMTGEQPCIDAPPFRLRPFADSDIGLIQAASADPHITNISTVPTTRDATEARAFIRRQHSRVTNGEGMSFAIARLADDVAVGYVGLRYQIDERVSIGYWVGPEHRGEGAAAIALLALSEWVRAELHIPRLELYVEQWNEASIHTAESAGFLREGLLHSWQRVDGSRRDMWMYSLVDGEPLAGVR